MDDAELVSGEMESASRLGRWSLREFDPGRPVAGGRKIKVVFSDGEVLVGTTQGYQPNRPGLFVLPANLDSNIERCYVVAAATREITLL
jgi:uncharacterized protein DUF6982